jgi:hypothetical protein
VTPLVVCDRARVEQELRWLRARVATLGDVSPTLPHVCWLRARIEEWNA